MKKTFLPKIKYKGQEILGAETKQELKEILVEEEFPQKNNDENYDFNLDKQKPLAKSGIEKLCKTIGNNIQNIKTPFYHQNYDRLKIWVDLRKFYGKIDFYLFKENMLLCNNPEERPSKAADRLIKAETVTTNLKKRNANTLDDEDIEIFDLSPIGIDNESNDFDFIIDEEVSEAESQRNETNRENLYPNCRISYKKYTDTVGINNIYIKNDILVIDITGRIMAEEGILGCINKGNINECLSKIIDLDLFLFDRDCFIEYANVYLCDACIDLEYENVNKVINGLSSFMPIATADYRVTKYGSHGIQVISKAQKYGNTLCIYNKYQELKAHSNHGYRTPHYVSIIGTSGMEIAKHTLRIECKMFRLQDIRSLLEISSEYKGIVRLKDVLESKAKPILNRFDKFRIKEENIKERLFAYNNDLTSSEETITSHELFVKRLAAERIAEIIKENIAGGISQVKTALVIEYGIQNENFISDLLPIIRSIFLDFILYRKPKSTRITVDLLNDINNFYGRRISDG